MSLTGPITIKTGETAFRRIVSSKGGIPESCQGCSAGGVRKLSVYLRSSAAWLKPTKQKMNISKLKPTRIVLIFILIHLLCDKIFFTDFLDIGDGKSLKNNLQLQQIIIVVKVKADILFSSFLTFGVTKTTPFRLQNSLSEHTWRRKP
jgi:hypothetical protein